jgi:hypothetical protein
VEGSDFLADVLKLGEALVLVGEEVFEGFYDRLVVLDFPVFQVLEVAVVGLGAEIDLL